MIEHFHVEYTRDNGMVYIDGCADPDMAARITPRGVETGFGSVTVTLKADIETTQVPYLSSAQDIALLPYAEHEMPKVRVTYRVATSSRRDRDIPAQQWPDTLAELYAPGRPWQATSVECAACKARARATQTRAG